MFRFRNSSTLVACLAALAVGVGGCSGNHSILPIAAPQVAGSNARPAHSPHGLARLASQPPVGMQMAFLMTDGSVLTQGFDASSWYRYTPDANGGYVNGTWTQVASLPSNYCPSAFASAVLADGRLLISGGEYNCPYNYDLQLTNLGAVYDPKTNAWTPIGHPKGWRWIGDSPSTLLPDGRFLLGQKLTHQDAVLDPATLQWTRLTDTGK